MKNLRLLLAFAVVLTLLSSCKKADITKTSILTSHKWVLTSSSTTYSDTSLVTNNLAGLILPCEKDGYTEFRDFVNNSTTRQFYNYTETKCVNETADVTSGDWDLDKEQAFLTMSGSGGNGQSWSWAITTLDDSKIVLTNTQYSTVYKYNPNTGAQTSYTKTTTTVQTWTAK